MSSQQAPNCCLIYRDRYTEIQLFGPSAMVDVVAGVQDYSVGVCPQFDVAIAPPHDRRNTPVQCLGGPFDGNQVSSPQVLVGSIGMRPALSLASSATPDRPSIYRWDNGSFHYDAAATNAMRQVS